MAISSLEFSMFLRVLGRSTSIYAKNQVLTNTAVSCYSISFMSSYRLLHFEGLKHNTVIGYCCTAKRSKKISSHIMIVYLSFGW